MSTLYVVQAQPNPPGRDTVRRGYATTAQLNEEWIEVEARDGDRNLTGDVVSHLTFAGACAVTGQEDLIKLGADTLRLGQRLRLHTGPGINQWVGNILHIYLGRGWYVWNNDCGDRATITFQGTLIDSAGYRPRPPEGILVRIPGTDRLERLGQNAVGWR